MLQSADHIWADFAAVVVVPMHFKAFLPEVEKHLELCKELQTLYGPFQGAILSCLFEILSVIEIKDQKPRVLTSSLITG